MTTTVLLLGGVLVIALALALELLRVSRAPQALQPARLQQELSDPAMYRPMARLFAQQDLAFLSARAGMGGAVRRLRRERCAVMQLYVRQMRRDFHRVWSVCRLLAPVSQNADLSVLLIRQYAVFHALCAVLYLRCLLGWYGYADFEIRSLVGALNHLRVCAASALQSGEAFPFQGAVTRVS